MEQDAPEFRWPLSNAERQRIVAAIEKRKLAICGPNVPQLVEYVEEALNPAPAKYRFLGMSVAEVEELHAGQDDLIASLTAIGAQAKAILERLPPQRGSRGFAEACKKRPWLGLIDPLSAALTKLMQGQRHDRAVPRMANIRTGLSALAMLADFTPPPKPRGPKVERSPGVGIVRAVCLYRHMMGLSLSFDWTDTDPKRVTGGSAGGHRARTEWIGTTETNELILVVAKEFGVKVESSRLRGDLLHYRKELKAAGRDNPLEIDLYGEIFDFESKKDLDAMLKAMRSS